MSDFNETNGDDDDLIYYEVPNTDKMEIANQWDKVDCVINLKGAEIGDDESDGLRSLEGSDSNDVGNK